MKLIDRTAKPLPRFQLMRLAKTNTDRRFYFQTTKRGNSRMTTCNQRPISRKRSKFRLLAVALVALAIIGSASGHEPDHGTVRVYEDCTIQLIGNHSQASHDAARILNEIPDRERFALCDLLAH
jgi:hypothetical protein